MQLIHKVDLNILSDDKIRLTHNDINVHIFEITVPDFIDNPENLEITMNIVDLWGNYVRINNEGLEGRKVRFRLTEFFKSIGTRTCEVVFSKDNKIYHAQKFKYHVEKNLDDDCSIVETEQYPILLELLDRVKKQLEETGALNSEVEELINSIEDKLAKGEFDGRSVYFKVEGMRVGFKYSDEEEYEWVDLETKIPAPVMKEIEKIQFKADKSYVDSQVIQLKENIDTKVNQNEYDETIQLLKEDVKLKAYKSELKTKLSEFENDSEYITLQEVPQFDDSDLKNSINQLEQNKANKEHTHVSSEVKHNSTTLDKELSTINSNLKEKANKIDVPNKVSQLENDKGYITEADIDLTEVNENIKELQDNKANKIHTHSSNDISVDDKTLAEALETINNTLDNKANSSELKTKLSEFENDTKFTTLDEVNKSDTIKNINVELAKKVDKSEKGKADGIVPLNKDSKIALEYLPDLSKQQTNIVETVEDMQKLEKLLAGDKAFVVSSGDSYIWSGSEWKVLSKAEWENINLDWANIVNNPLTSDDLVNIFKIHTKADKTDIPTKTSQLNNDNGYITMEDVPVIDLSGINKQLADLTLNKADKEALELIQETINSNKEKWSKDTVYDDTEVRVLIDLKADKKSLDSGLSKKVDKVDGKTLSTNDYSDLDKIEVGKVKDKADKSAFALKADKSVVDKISTDIADNRAKWEKDTIYDDTTIKNTITKKADTAYVDTELSKKVNVVDGKGLSTNDYTTVDKNEVAKIKDKADKSALNAIVTQIADNKELWEKDTVYDDSSIKTELETKADKTEIPTKLSQLEDDKNISKDIQILKDTKVDKVEGKGLSTNDYTNSEKLEVANVKDKADKTDLDEVKEDISNNRSKWEKDTIYDDSGIKADIVKKADISTVNTNLSKKVDKIEGKQLSTNDYTTVEKDKLSKLNNYDDTDIKADIAKKVDTSTVNTNLAKKVDKVSGKGLSTNDYTTAEKNKLSGIATGAQVNTVTSVAGRTGAVTVNKSDVGLGDVTNDKQMPISGGILENYREKLVTVAAIGGSINLSLGNVFQHTPSGNITYSITNAVNGQAHSFTLIINMGSTVRTLTFPASVKWQGGEIPDLTTASKTYVLTFMTINGGSTWLGMFGGEF